MQATTRVLAANDPTTSGLPIGPVACRLAPHEPDWNLMGGLVTREPRRMMRP